jgi:hypothetical protein
VFTEFTDCCSTPLRRRDGPQGRLQGQPSSPEPLKDKTTHKGRTPTHYPSTGSVWKGSLLLCCFFLHCRLPLQDYQHHCGVKKAPPWLHFLRGSRGNQTTAGAAGVLPECAALPCPHYSHDGALQRAIHTGQESVRSRSSVEDFLCCH